MNKFSLVNHLASFKRVVDLILAIMRPDYGSCTVVSNVVEQLLHDGSKELAQSDTDSAKYVLSNENKV